MFCRQCGSELQETQKFCGECGAKVTHPAPHTENPAALKVQPEVAYYPKPEVLPMPYQRAKKPWFKRVWVWPAVTVFGALAIALGLRYSLFSLEPARAASSAPNEQGAASPGAGTAPPMEITLRESETELTQYFPPEAKQIPLTETPPPGKKEEPFTYNEAFVFDGLEIVCHDAIRWEYLDNEFSDHHMADVFIVPVTITNVGRESNGLNLLYYTKYGPDGLELDDVSFYFDKDLHASGDIRPGATLTGDMYFLYNGDGDYYIEFENFLDKIEVRLPVRK